MSPRSTDRTPYLAALVGAAAALGAAVPLAIAVFGSPDLLLYAFKDDGFYFLALARNIAAGHGATFDALGPTNGFHPLWALILTPLFWLPLDSAYAAARGALVIAAALHVGAGYAIHRAARGVAGPGAAAAAAALYLVNPLALYLVVSGMESPVVALLVALAAMVSIRLRRGELSIARPSTAVWIGALCGLCMLARTDLVLLAGLVLAFAALRPAEALPGESGEGPRSGALDPRPRERRALERESPGRRAPDRHAPDGHALRDTLSARLRGAVLAAGVAALVVSPWIVWNLLRFGTIVQVSAQAHHLHAWATRGPGAAEGAAAFLAVGLRLARSVLGSIAGRAGLPPGMIVAALVAALGIAIWWLLAVLSDDDARRRSIRAVLRLDAPLLYASGFLAATFFVLGHLRSWYIAGPLAVAGILLAIPFDLALSGRRIRFGGRIASGLVVTGAAAALLSLGPVFAGEVIGNARRGIHAWREAAEWVAANTPENTRVASFNSGTFGFLAPRTVVNLDCVVNNRALPFLEQRRLYEFLERNRIAFVIDGPWWVDVYTRAYGEPGERGLVPIDTLKTGLVVYRPETAAR